MTKCVQDVHVLTIISEGHHYWVDDKGGNHITFFKNTMGKKLKKMWKQLKKPIRRKSI